jgi:AcrR family transcriptional regulator
VDLRSAAPTAPRERADAARNRRLLLDAAARLFAERGVAAVSIDDVAAAAGVGKGTVFRRFGDKSGLAVALLDERERELQQAILAGPPPLGPGAAPGQRLAAFVEAYLDYATGSLELVRLSETASPGARYRIGSYRFWHRHVQLLLEEAVVPDADALAHVLLAPLAADLLHGLGPEQRPAHRRAVVALVAAALATGQGGAMTEPDADQQHVAQRAELLPEERAAGSADPQAQAEAVLAESQDRTEHPDPDESTQSGRRSSADTA